jgi:hypothetical protein
MLMEIELLIVSISGYLLTLLFSEPFFCLLSQEWEKREKREITQQSKIPHVSEYLPPVPN